MVMLLMVVWRVVVFSVSVSVIRVRERWRCCSVFMGV